jgi:CheY-like chemotaxis protein
VAVATEILVVEDEDELRASIADALSGAGYAVGQARNGAEALEYLKGHGAPRVILLDHLMPVMHGIAFLSARNDDPRLSVIPVLLMTAVDPEIVLGTDGSPGGTAARRCRAVGTLEFIRKPLDLDALVASVRALGA